MPSRKMVTCFPIESEHVSQIEKSCGEKCEVIVASQESIANDIHSADVFCGHAKVTVDWERVVDAGRLKWIQSSSAGLDHCLVPEVIDSEIVVSGCSGLFANQVAEQTLALVFGLLRGLPVFFHQQERREFVRRPTDDFHGKAIGILGLGGNGLRVAQTLRSMATGRKGSGRIEATDWFHDELSTRPDVMSAVDRVLPPERTDELLGRSDVVIVSLPLTAETSMFFDSDRFRAMKRDSYFFNVGRGGLVDHRALIEQLESGRIAGAGLDVCDPEPLPENDPLWSADNVLITPHVGAQSRRRVDSTVKLFCENFQRWDNGLPQLNLIDKRLGFPQPVHRLTASQIESFLAE